MGLLATSIVRHTGFTEYGSRLPVRNCALGRDDVEYAVIAWLPYASPAVSNIAASIACCADLPAHTTNWNAG